MAKPTKAAKKNAIRKKKEVGRRASREGSAKKKDAVDALLAATKKTKGEGSKPGKLGKFVKGGGVKGKKGGSAPQKRKGRDDDLDEEEEDGIVEEQRPSRPRVQLPRKRVDSNDTSVAGGFGDNMDVDKFFESGWLNENQVDDADDAESNADSDAAVQFFSEKQKQGVPEDDGDDADDDLPSMAQYKKQLAALKQKDPEFMKFLEENDQSLLEILDESDPEEEEGVSRKKSKTPAKKVVQKKPQLDEQLDSDEDQHEDDPDSEVEGSDPVEEAPPRRQKREGERELRILTMPLLRSMIDDALNKKSMPALRALVVAFRSALPEEAEDLTPHRFVRVFRVDGTRVHRRLLFTALTNFHNLFAALFRKQNSLSADTPLTLVHIQRGSAPLQRLLKSYLTALLMTMQTASDPVFLSLMVQQVQQLTDFMPLYPRMPRKFIKVMLSLWASGDQLVRVNSFLTIRHFATKLGKTVLDLVLKGIYLTFVRNSKFTNAQVLPSIIFMTNCVSEVFFGCVFVRAGLTSFLCLLA
eukprot:TRINITY_DN4753_c0_g1_i1.p1 TRINITY_DN4753_c0_g1~~TRINITY_DN4753_c0_g1_i1.p1  ORF type:complete len:526 (+),score=132.53 TRINITY_DN4753_c0_g1_i1:10-1587(+)